MLRLHCTASIGFSLFLTGCATDKFTSGSREAEYQAQLIKAKTERAQLVKIVNESNAAIP